MTWVDWLALVGAVGGPVSGLVIAVIVDRRAHRTSNNANTTASRAVEVDEKEAHTHEIAMIIEGFTQSLESLRTDLTRTSTELTSARGEIGELRNDLVEANRKIDLGDRVRGQMITHIIALEHLIPTPPGPPTRPNWEVGH